MKIALVLPHEMGAIILGNRDRGLPMGLAGVWSQCITWHRGVFEGRMQWLLGSRCTRARRTYVERTNLLYTRDLSPECE